MRFRVRRIQAEHLLKGSSSSSQVTAIKRRQTVYDETFMAR
jgi:hypothetical protein